MPKLQERLDEFRKSFESGAPPYNAPHEVIETMHRATAELKATVLRRWPGGLIDVYGMTEGGGTCLLMAHEHPDKLHTVGRPAAGHGQAARGVRP